MARKTEIEERDGWLWDERGNRNKIARYGSREAAEKALLSLINCDNCINCSDCSDCSYCSGCSDCSDCSYCSYCSDCSDCSGCSGCSRCSGCSYCSGCSGCSRCSDCSGCSDCSRCSGCSDCSRCSRCSGCSGCSDKQGDTNAVSVVIPRIENIHQAIYEAASQPEALDMASWHCGTTHCRAGWVVTLAGEEGRALEEQFNTELAAMLIYRESGAPINPCRFYDSNDAALADMKRLAEAEAASA